jgi:hypothetical protein
MSPVRLHWAGEQPWLQETTLRFTHFPRTITSGYQAACKPARQTIKFTTFFVLIKYIGQVKFHFRQLVLTVHLPDLTGDSRCYVKPWVMITVLGKV